MTITRLLLVGVFIFNHSIFLLDRDLCIAYILFKNKSTIMKAFNRLWVFVFFVITLGSLTAQENDIAREKLLMLLSGEWVSRGLYVATKLEISDHLQAEPKSIDELAILTESNPESLYRLLHMLAGFDIFEEVSPRIFANTEASQLLAKANPETLHSLSLFYGEEIHRSWDQLLPSIQTGTPAFELTYKQPVFNYFKD